VIVGIDVDGVLRDLVAGLTSAYRYRYPDHEVKPVTAWDLSEFFPIGAEIYDFMWNGETCWQTYMGALPYPGARLFVQKLCELDAVEVALVTCQPTENSRIVTLEWLRIHGFLGLADDVFVVGDRAWKWRICFNVLLDDNGETIEAGIVAGADAFCMDRPWNRGFDVPRVCSYDEFLTKLKSGL